MASERALAAALGVVRRQFEGEKVLWALAERDATRAMETTRAALDATTREVGALRARVRALECELENGRGRERRRSTSGKATMTETETLDVRADSEADDDFTLIDAAEILRALRAVEVDLHAQRVRDAARDARARKVKVKSEEIAIRGSPTGSIAIRALRARHALKQINYAEPSLKVKLRREDVEVCERTSRTSRSEDSHATAATPTLSDDDTRSPGLDLASALASASTASSSPSSPSSTGTSESSADIKTPIDHVCTLSPERAPASSPKDIVAALPASKPQIWKASPPRRDASRPSRGVRVNYTEPNLVRKMRRDA